MLSQSGIQFINTSRIVHRLDIIHGEVNALLPFCRDVPEGFGKLFYGGVGTPPTDNCMQFRRRLNAMAPDYALHFVNQGIVRGDQTGRVWRV